MQTLLQALLVRVLRLPACCPRCVSSEYARTSGSPKGTAACVPLGTASTAAAQPMRSMDVHKTGRHKGVHATLAFSTASTAAKPMMKTRKPSSRMMSLQVEARLMKRQAWD